MPPRNFERMIQLAEDSFGMRTDSQQLSVDEKVISRLQQIHPATVSEYDDSNGPVIWILIFPTKMELMKLFLKKEITEKELFEMTPLHIPYQAIYLCSAMVLEEYRRKGMALKMTMESIENIRKDHPIQVLFVWPFSKVGEALAENIAALTGLTLKKRDT